MKSTSPFYPQCLSSLKQSALFSGLDEDQLGNMLKGFRRQTWKKQTPIDVQTTSHFCVVTKGRVELVRTDYKTGRDLTVFLIGPGDAFDVITLLDSQAHDITPIALDQVDLLSIPISSVREWIQAHPAFNRNFLPYLGVQMRALEDLAADLALHDTVTRLGNLLTRHLSPQGPRRSGSRTDPVTLIHDLSHEELARMIGSVRVVVTRHIQQWKQEGLVSTRRKQLAIRDMDGILNHCQKISKP